MIFIVPAKSFSSRAANKNFRNFHDGKSLVEILLDKLVAIKEPNDDILVSCDNEEIGISLSGRYGVLFNKRPSNLCKNETPITDWFRYTSRLACVEQHKSVAWCQVCDPFFDKHADVIRLWREKAEGSQVYDSVVVANILKHCYLLQQVSNLDGDLDLRPVGWAWGEHHTTGQELPIWYTMAWTMSVMSTKTMQRYGYHIGRKPLWFPNEGFSLDIDTEQQFVAAQKIYGTQRLGN